MRRKGTGVVCIVLHENLCEGREIMEGCGELMTAKLQACRQKDDKSVGYEARHITANLCGCSMSSDSDDSFAILVPIIILTDLMSCVLSGGCHMKQVTSEKMVRWTEFECGRDR